MSSNKEEPSPFSIFENEIEEITRDLQDGKAITRQRKNTYNLLTNKLHYPIKETHTKVYHVSAFNLSAMRKILYGGGLKRKKHNGIFYNTTEYALVDMDTYKDRCHISELHALGMYYSNLPSHYFGKFGIIPLNVTYEIDTKGFESSEVYQDDNYKTPPEDDNGEEFSIYRYVVQNCIPSQYIRLKAITFVLPMFGYSKVIWRRK